MRIFQLLQMNFKTKAVFLVLYIRLYDVAKCLYGSKSMPSECVFTNCVDGVICTEINDEVTPIAERVNEAVTMECEKLSLYIISSKFKNNILKPNWLNALNSTFRLWKLTLESCTVDDIEPEAFAKHPFTKLNILTIINSGLKMFKQGMFTGLRYLSTFAFRSNINTYELMVEEDALRNISSFLKIIEINRFTISPQSLINLFGRTGTHLSSLENIALGYNRIESIPEHAFMKAFQVQSIYLESNGITEVHEKAFWDTTVLKKLVLSNNSIESLKPLTFTKLQSLSDGSLHLNGNNWDCKCNLQWLKDMYLTSNTINRTTRLMCQNGLEFKDYEFCPPEVTTTVDPSDYITLQCQVINSSLTRSVNIDTNHTVELMIKDEVVTLEFQELEYEPLQVNILIGNVANDVLRNYFLLWFNSNNKSESGCITPISNNTVLTQLNRATTYTFSLVKENETEISPKASFGFTTSPEWSQRPWIINSNKALVLGLTSFSTIFLGCLAVVVTLFCLRTRQRKAVESKDAVAVPKNNYNYIDGPITKDYEKPAYWEPYVATSNQGYLTPKHNKYDKVKYRPTLSSSVSEWSVYTSSALYDEYNCKSDIWSTSQYKKRANYKQNTMNRYDELKPPLPPPNPHFST